MSNIKQHQPLQSVRFQREGIACWEDCEQFSGWHLGHQNLQTKLSRPQANGHGYRALSVDRYVTMEGGACTHTFCSWQKWQIRCLFVIKEICGNCSLPRSGNEGLSLEVASTFGHSKGGVNLMWEFGLWPSRVQLCPSRISLYDACMSARRTRILHCVLVARW